MTGRSYEEMKIAMLALGRYSMKKGTFVDGEISAYGAGFDLIKDYFEMIFREIIFSTAEDYGLKMLEDLYQIKQSQSDVAIRKSTISRYLKLRRTWNDSYLISVELTNNSPYARTVVVDNVLYFFGLNKSASDFHSRFCSVVKRCLPYFANISLGGDGRSFDKIDDAWKSWNYFDVSMMNFSMCDTI